ncbi:MAG: hypothetical protein ACJAS1_004033 [Oleiphilaceae bacterium]|jgi:hypothetical protein
MVSVSQLTAAQAFDPNLSAARNWNDALLDAIRTDLARPTVHARNLFHSSAMMYDLWAVYDEVAKPFFLGQTVDGFQCAFSAKERELLRASSHHPEMERSHAISYAMRRLLTHRFDKSPGRSSALKRFDELFADMQYDAGFNSRDYSSAKAEKRAAALGLYLADCVIAFGQQDGSNESGEYKNQIYQSVNEPLDPTYSGTLGIIDPNRWQPLWFFDAFTDQSGNTETQIPAFVGAEWGNVVSFALPPENLTEKSRDNATWRLYHDPGAPTLIRGDGSLPAEYAWNHSVPAYWSSHLDPSDGVLWDISPRRIGNSSVLPQSISALHDFYDALNGGEIEHGHELNPYTGQAYAKQIVPRGDYTRVLAEFWADGPDSETPPGHWFTILNEAVSDHPSAKKQYKGSGPVLSDLEWDVKAYFVLGGGVHDAAVAAWGIKGWYDYVRPISAIRFMASNGQSSNKALPNYSTEGIPLVDGYVELVNVDDPLADENTENMGKIKVRAWRGPQYIEDPKLDYAGVGWILAENWWPYQRPNFVTPPFAGYLSGHSTFSRAAAEIITAFTGDAYFPGGMGRFMAKKNEFLVFEQGPSVDVELQWATYRDASDQTSLSRIWGGIHPPVDDMPGRRLGIIIAEDAVQLADGYFRGKNSRAVTHRPAPFVKRAKRRTLEPVITGTVGQKDTDEIRIKKIIALYGEVTESGLEAVIKRRYGKEKPAVAVNGDSPISFKLVTQEAGLNFFQSSGISEQRFYAELLGQGAIFFDADQDGDQDLYLLSGKKIVKEKAGKVFSNGFFINDGQGHFTDRSIKSGLNDSRFSVGVCGADYDNDGDTDLYVTNFDDNNALFVNDGSGHFSDIATASRVVGKNGFDASCAFGDVDGDGLLDLYVSYYVNNSIKNNPNCKSKQRAYCGPHFFKGPRDILYRNMGDGTFSDISSTLGDHTECRSLGVIFSDLDRDGDQDILTTCDRNPNLYFENLPDGFREVGLASGVALGEGGIAQAGMGVTTGDYDNDGNIDIAATYFVAEANGLYKNLGNNRFLQAQVTAGTAHSTARNISWGTEFFDADLDGDLDWITANGHAMYRAPGMPEKRHEIGYKQPNTLMLNRGDGSFTDLSNNAGSAFDVARQSRGLALADIDGDGDLDALFTNLNDLPELYRNDSPRNNNHWLKVKTVGTRSNRDGIGARVLVIFPDMTLTREVRSGQSYLSQSALTVHFGLGPNQTIPMIEVHWPSGAISRIENIPADQLLVIKEPAGDA